MTGRTRKRSFRSTATGRNTTTPNWATTNTWRRSGAPPCSPNTYRTARPGSSISDVGTGLVGRFLLRYGFADIDGLDISAEMLAQAKKAGAYGKLMQADLTAGLDIPDASYDAVISVGTFTHNHVGPQGLDEVLRIVKPGGIAAITVNGGAYVEDGYRAKFDQLVADEICDIVDERDEDYIIARDIRGRVVTLRKN